MVGYSVVRKVQMLVELKEHKKVEKKGHLKVEKMEGSRAVNSAVLWVCSLARSREHLMVEWLELR